ncbi:hypothetical protein ACKJL9_06345 [Legionella pneumophila]|uniref:hypothetical protein n=1 Tax=Legionella pneumophila TaxID=446 RepID=UPI0039866A02
MIDYEKLKLAHELANKLNVKLWVNIAINAEESYPFVAWINQCNSKHEIHCIDDLITKLKELTRPKPKYEIGQEIWVLVDNEPVKSDIYRIIEKTFEYRIDPYGWIHEDNIYPSREALIDAQIEYWHSLKEPVNPEDMRTEFEGEKIIFRCFDDEMEVNRCEHESDGISYRASDYGAIAHFKCKKCGEFYR